MRLIILIFLIIPTTLLAFENPKIKINNFYIQKYEVTIAEFSNFANKTNFKTEAEKQGFGYEYGVGWEKRKNWNYKTPYGKNPESLTEPAVKAELSFLSFVHSQTFPPIATKPLIHSGNFKTS